MTEEDALAQAVQALLADPQTDPGFEAQTVEEAAHAIRLFDDGLRGGLGVFRQIAERGQQGAEAISSDKLQVLSEIVQNADDVGASQIRLCWRPTELLIAHDGKGVRLADILRLGLPWLSGKTGDAEATGRFGIGLATLRQLSTSWEVHGHPYHVRFINLTLEPAEPLSLPPQIAGPRWTVFRIPLAADTLSATELIEWFGSWQDSSLLFLRSLKRVTVLVDSPADHAMAKVLRLSWRDVTSLRLSVGGTEQVVQVREARTPDGERWRVYDTRIPARAEWRRRHKALGASVPVAVALPLHQVATGSVHAGLPVAPLAVAARVHTQFDPVISREGFAASRLNAELVPVVADLWQSAVLDVLGRVEPSAWHLVPLPSPSAQVGTRLQDAIRAAFLERARGQVATRLSLPLQDGTAVPLVELAVEAAELTGVISGQDTAQLAKLVHSFPHTGRDHDGRWRNVLADWRAAGAAELVSEITVRDAVGLLSRVAYDVNRTVRLTAVALAAGLGFQLAHQRCVATADGRRLTPVSGEYAFAEGATSGLLDRLGVLLELHPAYWVDEEPARQVVKWLRQRDCLVGRDDTIAVLRRVARLGSAGGRLDAADLSNAEQLVLLQRALGEVPKAVREQLGGEIGRAVLLDAYAYGADGEEKTHQVRPAEVYLSQALESTDGDRFAVAARKTPGLLWAHRSYARSLLPASQSGGLSRTAFLRLLGVADTPRLRPVPRGPAGDVKEYTTRDSRVGLARNAALSPHARWWAMSKLGATFTLDDRLCPDLDLVVQDLITERDVAERRRRTAALLQTLGKHGMVTTPEQARVQTATAYHGWTERGPIAALWVWQLRDAAWLEDARGTLRRPGELQLRTADAEALYGQDEPKYLHPEFQRALASRVEVLTALGVAGDPDVPQLIERLRVLRKRPQLSTPVPEELKTEVYLVYRALARRLTERSADTSRAQVEHEIWAAFRNADELVLTDQGWRRPNSCFRGATILAGLRPFVPTGAELLPLWEALDVGEPDPEDLVKVLKELAVVGTSPTGEQQRVMLEALRSLCASVWSAGTVVSPGLRQKLRWLPLWTSAGWIKRRPVYAVSHPAVERQLADHVPLWQPGGEIEQFAGLLGLLGVQRLEAGSAEVVDLDGAELDPWLTESFRNAVTGLQDRLVRDEPAAAEAFKEWAWLAGLEVRILPELRIRLDLGEGRDPLEVRVDAQIDRQANAMFLVDPKALRSTWGGGHAVAGYFSGERTRVVHRWRDFWDEEEANTIRTVPLTSAGQRDHEEQQRRAELLRERAQRAAATPTRQATRPQLTKPAALIPKPRPTAEARPSTALPTPPASATEGAPTTPRRLIDPASLGKPTVTHTTPATAGTTPARPQTRAVRERDAGLPRPRPGGAVPRELSAPLAYQDRTKEVLVIQLLANVLGESATELDQRALPGLGADAVDAAGRYYEIKAHGGPLPAEVSLTKAEFLRAQEQRENYTLLLASHLEEGSGGHPTVRVINDPLLHFEVEPVSEIRLKGIREAGVRATIWEWPSN
ncbi:sacsin N-terminal ATP-binding-like domain-containing protein [Kitasatospora cathayae]|uniref:Protein NO VEIN C-terminal domain-containing protein n=1 Tax=Kitasatospora cathayae TaxID=3004092 RepID=A0ABY7Q5U3_9ACTN|nr:hypothetical protein [Kitasatospora sp. HUAS 3-15]WBP88096.1 hypothetical protein O1G21_21190 [Kitasatospora sp. HUAS 3-15]